MSLTGRPYSSAPQPTLRGEKGARGEHGLNGKQGIQGPKGEPGRDGLFTKVVFALENVQPRDLPKDGIFDPHFDSEGSPKQQIRTLVGESIIYKPNGSIWTYQPRSGFLGWLHTGDIATEIVNIPGPVGPEGDKGEKGDAGPTGNRGSDGFNGLPGRDGSKGEVGLKGDRGFPGKTGDKGVKGEKGLDGSDGADGVDGLNGTPGVKGEKGDIGSKGEQGFRGYTGSKGERGSDADALRLGLIPKAALNYSGVSETTFNQHNIGIIKKLETGVYRLRFVNKLASDNFVVMSQAVVEEKGKLKAKQVVVTQRTRSYCVVEVTDQSTGEYVDATIDVVIYNFSG